MNNDDETNFEDITQMGAHGKQDMVYMRSLSAAVVHRSPRHLIAVVMIFGLFVVAAITWMNWAKIDVVIRGSGKVSPASQVQNIQSLEGGIISEILVAEGQVVKTGQALIKISDVAFSSSFEENRLLYLELVAKASRLTAEAFDQAFKPDSEVNSEAPQLIKSEKSLFDSNQQQLKETLSILEEKISQQKKRPTRSPVETASTAKVPGPSQKRDSYQKTIKGPRHYQRGRVFTTAAARGRI